MKVSDALQMVLDMETIETGLINSIKITIDVERKIAMGSWIKVGIPAEIEVEDR